MILCTRKPSKICPNEWKQELLLMIIQASDKESACQCKRLIDVGSIPGLGRSPGGVHGNPLQYSCLENPIDREAWWATVHRVEKSWAWLNDLAHTHSPKTKFSWWKQWEKEDKWKGGDRLHGGQFQDQVQHFPCTWFILTFWSVVLWKKFTRRVYLEFFHYHNG